MEPLQVKDESFSEKNQIFHRIFYKPIFLIEFFRTSNGGISIDAAIETAMAKSTTNAKQ